MERAAFYAAWQEKKLRGLFLTAAGNSGNAATRLEAFVYSKGSYAYGGYPDIDELFQQRSEEHTSELQSLTNLVCRLLLEKKKKKGKQRNEEGTRRQQKAPYIELMEAAIVAEC